MISITVRYYNVLRQRAGIQCECLELPEGTEVHVAIQILALRHGPGLAEMLLSQAGEISPHLVVFRNQELVFPGRQALSLADEDELKLFPAISGG
jgi:molybdopterin converting factor small subunit